jgi:hypothetical protein
LLSCRKYSVVCAPVDDGIVKVTTCALAQGLPSLFYSGKSGYFGTRNEIIHDAGNSGK